jgi:hypothetical protein
VPKKFVEEEIDNAAVLAKFRKICQHCSAIPFYVTQETVLIGFAELVGEVRAADGVANPVVWQNCLLPFQNCGIDLDCLVPFQNCSRDGLS